MILLVIGICSSFSYRVPSRGAVSRQKRNSLEEGVEQAINNPIEYQITSSIAMGHKRTDLLLAIWEKVAFPVGEISFKLSDYGLTRDSSRTLLDHFQSCKDYAGDNAFLMAMQDDEGNDILLLNDVSFKVLSEDDDEVFGEEDYSELLSQYTDDADAVGKDIFPNEPDDNIVMRDTRQWVQSVIAGLSVCPFTIDPDKAGIPLGGVRYRVSRAKSVDEAFFRYWEELKLLQTVPEKEISTVLLIFPELELFGNYELFEGYCESLQDSLSCSTLGMEEEFQLVFFHPKYMFRDGHARSGEDMGAANFARRSPWPMINILRTHQVRAAQKGVPTGLVYKQNEERLSSVGTRTLENMLYSRKWDDLPWLNPRAARPIADAASIDINWRTVSPLHFSSSPQLGSDLPGKCPFTSEEQVTSHCDYSLKLFYMLININVCLCSNPQRSQRAETKCPVIHDQSASTSHVSSAKKTEGKEVSVASAIDLLKSKGSEATEVDYTAFADEITKWLAEQEQQSNPSDVDW